jgi:hypothetical protein
LILAVLAATSAATVPAALAGPRSGTSRLARRACGDRERPETCWVEQHAALLEYAHLMWLGCQIGAYPCRFVVPDWAP